jgi:hypothetical protein
MNPENFDIEEKKMFGLWPHGDLISYGMNPYVKRIREDRIVVGIVGDLRGEDVFNFLENNPKIIKINVVNEYSSDDNLKALFDKNTSNYKSKIGFGLEKDKLRDVVCIEKNACTLDNLVLYYNNVKSGGIFCGNGHETNEVKAALREFRRTQKIGTPIQVCYRTVWFWVKR